MQKAVEISRSWLNRLHPNLNRNANCSLRTSSTAPIESQGVFDPVKAHQELTNMAQSEFLLNPFQIVLVHVDLFGCLGLRQSFKIVWSLQHTTQLQVLKSRHLNLRPPRLLLFKWKRNFPHTKVRLHGCPGLKYTRFSGTLIRL